MRQEHSAEQINAKRLCVPIRSKPNIRRRKNCVHDLLAEGPIASRSLHQQTGCIEPGHHGGEGHAVREHGSRIQPNLFANRSSNRRSLLLELVSPKLQIGFRLVDAEKNYLTNPRKFFDHSLKSFGDMFNILFIGGCYLVDCVRLAPRRWEFL